MEQENSTKFIDKPTRRQRFQYFLKLLENVLLTGIPQIVQEKSIRRKMFKVTVFSVCIFGFFYQLTLFFILYFTYPTTLEVLVAFTPSEELPKPMVTVCDINGIRRTDYCKAFPERCETPANTTAFCESFHYFCEKKNLTESDLMFPLLEYYSNASYQRDLVIEYGTRSKDILNYSHLATEIMYTNELGRLRNCYYVNLEAIPSILKEPYKALNMRITETNMAGNLVVTFHPEESFRPNIPIGAKVSIHSDDQMINPFVDGFLVLPGKRYVVQLKAIAQDLLSSPYSTNCTNYDKEYKKDRRNPKTRHTCFIRCSKGLWVKKCGCISAEYPYETEEKICETKSEYICATRVDTDPCHEVCRKDCSTLVFEYQVQESPIEIMHHDNLMELDGKDKLHHVRERTSVMNFFFQRPELMIYKYKPKYEFIELFGYIGGYVGIWLGISLIAVCDFFEMLVNFTYHMIKGKVPVMKENSSITCNETEKSKD